METASHPDTEMSSVYGKRRTEIEAEEDYAQDERVHPPDAVAVPLIAERVLLSPRGRYTTDESDAFCCEVQIESDAFRMRVFCL